MHCGYANQTRRPASPLKRGFSRGCPCRAEGALPAAGAGGGRGRLVSPDTPADAQAHGGPRSRAGKPEGTWPPAGFGGSNPEPRHAPREAAGAGIALERLSPAGVGPAGGRRLLRLCCRVAARGPGVAELQPPETRDQLPPAPPACALSLPGRPGEGPRGLPGSGAEAAPALLRGRGRAREQAGEAARGGSDSWWGESRERRRRSSPGRSGSATRAARGAPGSLGRDRLRLSGRPDTGALLKPGAALSAPPLPSRADCST